MRMLLHVVTDADLFQLDHRAVGAPRLHLAGRVEARLHGRLRRCTARCAATVLRVRHRAQDPMLARGVGPGVLVLDVGLPVDVLET